MIKKFKLRFKRPVWVKKKSNVKNKIKLKINIKQNLGKILGLQKVRVWYKIIFKNNFYYLNKKLSKNINLFF